MNAGDYFLTGLKWLLWHFTRCYLLRIWGWRSENTPRIHQLVHYTKRNWIMTGVRKNVTRPLLWSTWRVTFNKNVVNACLWKYLQPPQSRQNTGFRNQRHRDLKERWLVGSVEQPIKSFLGIAGVTCTKLTYISSSPARPRWVSLIDVLGPSQFLCLCTSGSENHPTETRVSFSMGRDSLTEEFKSV